MSPRAVQQAGQANVAAQAALEYHSDLPWKAVVLLMGYVVIEAVKQSLIMYLSHSREMRRIDERRNNNGSVYLHS